MIRLALLRWPTCTPSRSLGQHGRLRQSLRQAQRSPLLVERRLSYPMIDVVATRRRKCWSS